MRDQNSEALTHTVREDRHGRITIPQAISERLGLEAGDILDVVVHDSGVQLIPRKLSYAPAEAKSEIKP